MKSKGKGRGLIVSCRPGGILPALLAAALIVNCGGGDGPTGATSLDEPGAVLPMFADEDGDGINDFLEFSTHYPGVPPGGDGQAVAAGPAPLGHAFTDGNGDRVCDHAQNGSPTWHGPGFLDEDGDGICDYWDEDRPQWGAHLGLRFRDRNRNRVNDHYEARWHEGCTHGWIDANGDGICDRAQDGSSAWHGPNCIDQDRDGTCDHYEPGGEGYFRHTWRHQHRNGGDGESGGNGNGGNGNGGGD